MRSTLTAFLLLASVSLSTQTGCVDDTCLQTFQEFELLSSAYCVLVKELGDVAYVPSFLAPWENYPASISSACSCLGTTSFSSSTSTSKSSSTSSASKCSASPTTVVSVSVSVSTVTASPSTVISLHTVLSTITAPASTVTSTSQVLVPTTVTDYSTLINTLTDTEYSTVINTLTDTEYSSVFNTVTDTEYSSVFNTVTDTEYSSLTNTLTETDYSSLTNTVTVTSLTESISTTTVVGSASTTSGSSSSASTSSSSSSTSTSTTSSTSSSSSSTSTSATSSTSTTSSSVSSTSTGTSCTCTAYSQIAPAVAACTQITLQDIAVPDGDSINLASLKAGSVVTFAGTTTFGYVNSSTFNPITLGGAGVTIQGAAGSIIDGNGQAYWDGQGSNGGVPKPDHFIVVDKLTANSVIKNLYIQNYPVHCFYIESCTNLLITNIQIDNSAGNAPNAISGGLPAAHNTDGFDISGSTNVVLSDSSVNNQDDCVAITSGSYITVSGLYCNGSHGLSIGSVGGKSNNNVTNILFTDSTVANSQNAARIKSNYNTTGFISNVTYSNIAVIDVSVYGVDIQQDYLNGGPTGIPSNGVIITDITISNVTGTAVAGAQDYYILCGNGSCSDFTFTNVNIVGGTVADSCNYPPSGCPGSAGSASSSTVSSSTTSILSTSSTVSSSTTSTLSTSTTAPSSQPTTFVTSSSAPTSTAVSPYAKTTPVAGAVVVDATGATAGSYLTVQAGVNALSLTSTTPQNLFIYPGTYTEQVYIPALKSNLTVQGYTLDGSSYEGNTATVTYNLALLDTTSDDLTATVRQWNPNTKFYNLNIANTFGHVSTNGQNLALSAHTTNQGYYGVQLWGYQDTLLSNTGNQLYSKSLIVGAIDFIFGQTATAWFDQVDIRTIATGCVTASGRASASNPSWYVINNSTVAGINSSIAAGINYLGRPWEQFARVVFQDTDLSDVIAPAGWRPWSTAVNGTTNTENVTFAEYDNYGPGSILEEGPRASYSEQLSEPIAIETVLGSGWTAEWWVDQAYMV